MKSGKWGEFFGDVVTGGYNKKKKKWRIYYDNSDADSEDWNIKELLGILRGAKKYTKIIAIFTDDEDETLAKICM